MPPADRKARGIYRLMHAVIVDGLLVQTYKNKVAVLDAQSGKKLWGKDLQGEEWQFPRVAGNRLILVRGQRATSGMGYLSGTPTMHATAIEAFDLKTGKQLWQHDISVDAAVVSYLTLNENYVATFNYHQDEIKRNKGKLVEHKTSKEILKVLDADTGEVLWTQGRSGENGFGRTLGGGHFNRLALSEDRVWVTGPSGAIGYSPSDKNDVERRYGGRNFHCATSVMTPNWVLGSQYFVNRDDWSKCFSPTHFAAPVTLARCPRMV